MFSVKHLISLRNKNRIYSHDTLKFLAVRTSSTDSDTPPSQSNIKKISTMEETNPDSTSKASYATVLAKGTLLTDNLSNNNPEQNGTSEENDSQSTSTMNSGIDVLEENKNRFTPDSLSDNFEDAEDDQSNFTSFSANDISVQSDETVNVEDTQPSSLVTELSSESNRNDIDIPLSSSVDELEEEEDSEEELESDNSLNFPGAIKFKFRSNDFIKDLPSTVTVLDAQHGAKVFVVGTAHFSKESQDDVAKTIQAVQPDIVVIELCKSRLNVLSLDESTILKEAETLNFQKMKQTIAENGVLQGILYILLLSMSAHLTKQLGMAPGGEFRRAYQEAKNIPGCIVHLGDRPIHVTLQRALAKLSLWQKIRIGWHMLRSRDPISKEEVERCKQRDLLEEMLAEMTGEFPELSQVFVKERDVYLTYSLQMAATPLVVAQNSEIPGPSYVVGVVGIGHVPGIQEHWGKVTEEDIPPVLCIPEPSKSSKFIRCTIRYSLYGLGLYGIYKICPRSLFSSKLLEVLKQPFGR